MSQTLIRWRLREVMARYNIKAIDLANEMGVSANSVSNLRRSNSMPRLDGDSLNSLCNALNNLAIDLDQEITPLTLIEYTRDLEPDGDLQSSSPKSRNEEKSRGITEHSKNNPSSSLGEVLNPLKSA